jgi:repressor LexA
MARNLLSPQQRTCFEAIVRLLDRTGRSPTLVELGNQLGITPQAADKHIRQLLRKGYLRALRKGPVRTLLPLDDEGTPLEANRLPILGKVAAGLPILAVENRVGSVTVDDSFVKRGASFCLIVQGDSMIEAGILPGDKVIVKQQPTAETGQIVLALIDQEATIKRFYPMDDGRVRLRPENPDYHDLLVSAEDCWIQGVVIGLYRDVV